MRFMLLTALVLLAGCVTEGKVMELPPIESFSASVPVRLEPYERDRVDPLREEFADHYVRTGPYWTLVFSDSEDIDEVFTIKNAHMYDNGFSPRTMFTYKIEGELSCDGNTYPINAQGSRSTGSRVQLAKADAVERAMLSLVNSIGKHLEHCERTAHRASPRPSKAIDAYDELLMLKDLVDKGILTQAEFESEKKKLLGTT